MSARVGVGSSAASSAHALAVLADPTRARIVDIVRSSAGGRTLVGQLADELGLRQPTISHHMGVLLAEGIVVREPEGRRVWYSIHPDQVERLGALLGKQATSTEADLDRVIDDLAARFRGALGRETVARYVTETHELLARNENAPWIASRTAAWAVTRLEDLERQHRPGSSPTVLFVCVQNAGRSQLAAGILRQLAGDRVVVRTAGSAPADSVRHVVAIALDEIGVSVGGEFPKPLTDEAVRAADVVVTMGCGDACPVYPDRRYLDWDLDDPVGKPLSVVREIRDDIDGRVRALLRQLDAESVAAAS